MKTQRRLKIIEIIKNYDIDTQEELAEKLMEAGFEVTQATISRDIRELNLTKVASSKGKQKYTVVTPSDKSFLDRQIRVFRDAVISLDVAQNLVVIKTLVGMAMAVAAALDAMDNPEIVGTIAGDDTLFCALKTERDALLLVEKLDTYTLKHQ